MKHRPALVTAALAAVLLMLTSDACAHRIDEYLQATLLTIETDRLQGAMRLIPGTLVAPSVIARIDSDGDGVFSDAEQGTYAQRVVHDLSMTIDGSAVQPRLVSWSFPTPAQMLDGLGEIHVEYTVVLAGVHTDHTVLLANHHLEDESVYLANVLLPKHPDIRIVAQKRNPQQSEYELDYRQGAEPPFRHDTGGGIASWWGGLQLSSLFRLGMRHIAEGTDHLMFLLVLLLPAPLLASRGRWGRSTNIQRGLLRVMGIITAFSIGHSITLMLAAVWDVDIPSRPVEVMIAISIFVSAVHAMRPLFPGREAAVAGLFGLVHGLAFASTLDHLGIGRWDRVAGTLAFNAGIEAMQLLVVAAILPSLFIISGTSSYRALRLIGAAFAGAVSATWVAARLADLQTPVVDAMVDALAKHAVVTAAALLAIGVMGWRSRWRSVLRRVGPSVRQATAVIAVVAVCWQSRPARASARRL